MSLDQEISGAEIILQALKDQEVDTIFGYPGGAVLPIYDAIFGQNFLKHVLVRQEAGAVHAAEGFARSSGKVGVLLVTSGPGVTNVVTGLTDALMDSIPIVCISGQVPSHLIGTDAFQECDTTGITRPCTKHNYLVKDVNKLSEIIKKYLENFNNAQTHLFGNSYVNNKKKNIKILPMLLGDLNQCSMNLLSDFLKSDVYVVFGSSYIKGELVDFLVKQKAINIHAGVSPYYRGTDCNFWALYDDNPHLVGTTIHLLSKGLDSGPMLYHAMSNLKSNPFEYTMSTIKSAFHSIPERIKDGSIFTIKPIVQDKIKEVRYSKKSEFSEDVVKEYFEKKIDLNSKKFDNSLLKEPLFLDN